MIRTAKPIRGRINTFYVPSDTSPGTEYIVHNTRHHKSHRRVLTCNCKDFTERRIFNGEVCKHIQAVINEYPVVVYTKRLREPYTTKPARTAKSALAIVVEVLNANNQDSCDLWNILTALRGPDSDTVELKYQTTSAIRGAIGLKPVVFSSYGAIINHEPLMIGSDFYSTYKYALDKLQTHNPQPHFIAHYAKAVLAIKKLGLA